MRGASFCLLVPLACGVGIGACGSDGETTVIKTVTEPPAGPDDTTTVTEHSSDSPGSSPGPVRNYEGGPVRHLAQFQLPSGNIGCYVSTQASGYARCDIGARSWSPPPQPAGCDLDWGQGMEVSGSGKGRIVCAGDTTRDSSAPVLDYGQSSRAGPMLCQSSKSGVTCTNTDTGHGFFLASESYRLF